MAVSGCWAFAVMKLPTWCVSVVMGSKGDGVTVLERGGWHVPLNEWLSTLLERSSHEHHLCGVDVNGRHTLWVLCQWLFTISFGQLCLQMVLL